MSDVDTSTPIELLTFQLLEQEYALDIMSVREIRGWTRATPLPHSPHYMKGVINLRGTVLPVLDLGARLGMEPRGHSDRNVVIVVEHEKTLIGLLVDAVSDIIALTADKLQPPPELAGNGTNNVVSSLTHMDERMIRVLNLDEITTLPKYAAA